MTEDGTNSAQGSFEVTTEDGRSIPYDPRICPFRHVLDAVGDKWSIIIISHLKGDSRRFSDLRRLIPDISQRMLTQTLRKLERDGYVQRTVTPTTPPRVDYALTSFGNTLCARMAPLADWAEANADRVARARALFDDRTAR